MWTEDHMPYMHRTDKGHFLARCMCTELLSHVQLFVTPWTVSCQAPLFLEFSRQEYWSGLPFPLPGDLPNTGIEPKFPALQTDSLPSQPPGKSSNREIKTSHILELGPRKKFLVYSRKNKKVWSLLSLYVILWRIRDDSICPVKLQWGHIVLRHQTWRDSH